MAHNKVAVTGIGLVTAIGASREDVWAAVRAGCSPMRRVRRFDATGFRSQIACEVDGFDFTRYQNGHRSDRFDRFSEFAVAAARDAILDARLVPEAETAVYLGSALGGIAFGEEQHKRYVTNGIKSVAPNVALTVFAGAAATNVAIELGLRGPAMSNANSCASGAISIGEAFHLIRNAGIKVALAGGVECPLAPLTFGSFSLIKAMSRRNDNPETSCRPFDLSRDGFVMAEGAAILVLEEWEHATLRGAHILAEILGYATTNDAHHMTVPRPDGSEAARAIRLALDDASVAPCDVDYINAHATGTVLGDAAEARAIRAIFGESTPPISGTKPLHGHALGASPAIEAAITVMAMNRSFVPATANLTNIDPDCPGNHVLSPGREIEVRVALSNAFGFGGINAALVFGRA
ncbi:MAG TPA: beta-ketoacyl-[acyl-carrier-protein] synthase family protein [Chloroflexota bacterium]|nr:beta-ketoacyl-[acyl-carrier-protein] synthase family protein [Chloroflexota bacterium]